MATILLDLCQAAERLGISPETLRRRVTRGQISHRRPGGRLGSIYFTETDLAEYVEAVKCAATAGPVAERRPA